MKSLIAILVLSSMTGCASYRHTRKDATTGTIIEETTLRAPWLSKTVVQGLKTRTSDKHGTNIYTRSVGLENATNETDAEGIKALQGLIGAALLQALSSGAK